MSTALEIVNEAYLRQNMDALSSFSTSQEFPGKIGLSILNRVIREMNRLGNFIFTETETPLTYTAGVYTYTLSTLGVDPKRIRYIRKEASNHWGYLVQNNRQDFKESYRMGSIQTTEPTAWMKFNDTLELNTIPDQDYSLRITHFKDMPLITATTDSQTTGAILVPEKDEDLLIDGIEVYLCEAIGKADWTTKLQRWEQTLRRFIVDDAKDVGLALQMPSLF